MVLSMSVLMIRFFIPLLKNQVVTTKFERSFLSNSIGYTGNKTLTQENGNTLKNFFNQKSTNFHSIEFNLTEFIGSIRSISEFSITQDMMERVSVTLYGPNKPDNMGDDTNFIELMWGTEIYNEAQYITFNTSRAIDRASENYKSKFGTSMPTKLILQIKNNKK